MIAHIKHDKLEQGIFFSTFKKQSEEKSRVEQYRRKSGVSTRHCAEQIKLRDHRIPRRMPNIYTMNPMENEN